MDVHESWNKIHALLSEQFPAISATLSQGATQTEIDALEGSLNFPLPQDLKSSLLLHNGQHGEPGLFNVMRLLSCSEILSQYQLAKEIYGETGPAHPSQRPDTRRIATDVGWGEGWVPVASFQGSYVVVDCLPPNKQHFGQVFETDYQCPTEVLYEAYSSWLAHYANAFSSGLFRVKAGAPIV